MMAAALSTHLAGMRQVVVVGNDDHKAGSDLVLNIEQRYLPFVLSLNLSQAQQQALASKLPFVAAMRPVDGAPAAYVCREFTCRAPVTTVVDLERELATPAYPS